jgi:hypothetical protein
MTKGTYFGGTIGSPWGIGGELYMDDRFSRWIKPLFRE